jgi:hypothetical protein
MTGSADLPLRFDGENLELVKFVLFQFINLDDGMVYVPRWGRSFFPFPLKRCSLIIPIPFPLKG